MSRRPTSSITVADRDAYEIRCVLDVHRPPADVMRLLSDPDELRRWMTAIEVTAVQGHERLRIVAGAGRRFAGTLDGTVVSLTPTELVRRWQPPAGDTMLGGYERVVVHRLVSANGGCAVQSTVSTTIPGISRRAATAGARADARGIVRTLERLRRLAETGRASRLRGLLATDTPQPL